jgi:D-glycero-alpha-D-manno-heptose-7-phosphate kinase
MGFVIITRSPLRITLGGGGTDLASYYHEYGGFLIASAIDKYVYITLNKAFRDEMILKYSKMETVSKIDDIQHPIIREALRLLNVPARHLEVASMADIPAGTGLGSSGSFTTALLKALHTWQRNLVHPAELAEQACHLEIDILHEPIGKQDQYIAAFGGLTCFRFHTSGQVEAWPLRIPDAARHELEDSLLLFFTGYSRSASDVLKDQDNKTRERSDAVIQNLHAVKEAGLQTQKALEAGDTLAFADLMNVQWERKRQRSAKASNDQIDAWYKLGRDNGARGGKLIGAGGGGFLMFYAEDRGRLRQAMAAAGLQEVRFRFDLEGTKVIINS